MGTLFTYGKHKFTTEDAAAGAAAGLQGAAGALSANAAMAQANAEKMASEYNATLAILKGNDESRRIYRMAQQTISSQWVQMAGKSGVIDESGIYRMARNAEEMERDALNAAIAGRNTARLDRARGRAAIEIGKQKRAAALIGGLASAGGTLLSHYVPSA